MKSCSSGVSPVESQTIDPKLPSPYSSKSFAGESSSTASHPVHSWAEVGRQAFETQQVDALLRMQRMLGEEQMLWRHLTLVDQRLVVELQMDQRQAILEVLAKAAFLDQMELGNRNTI
ncbi:hypothetical protein CRENBAI_009649 [Crenichthys baileyi]|uniref:Uncharacterized protein n=1 Tax=Crenichthys baileyi TaxID=28760 RepID=A0AAV9RV07_9TELE